MIPCLIILLSNNLHDIETIYNSILANASFFLTEFSNNNIILVNSKVQCISISHHLSNKFRRPNYKHFRAMLLSS